MADVDFAAFAGDLPSGEPTGENLEFDADFSAMEREARGKPEQQYGDKIIEAEPPDWKLIDAQAQGLLERTRDLRVLAHLAVARLQLRGLPDYAGLVGVIRQLLETKWESVHPQLDPEDDNDPTLRANALLRLTQPVWVLAVLRELPLAASTRAGRISWRDLAIAAGNTDAEDGRARLTEAAIRAAFADTDPGRLAAIRAALATVADDIAAIPARFDAESGHGTGPDFNELLKLLRDMQKHFAKYAAEARTEAQADETAAEQEAFLTPDGAAPAQSARPAGISAAALGPITSRNDALLLLDLVRAYYERYEPSSPLPFLIDRARRLADKDFMDILRDLAPDGLNQAQHIAGTPME